MVYRFDSVEALEVLDSRGRPTIEVTVRLMGGPEGVAGVPAGASTGSLEAVEFRDGERGRYGGRGTRGAVGAVNGELRDLLVGRPWADLAELDEAMCELDGTDGKRRLGANSLVGVSMASARAMAGADGVPLWAWLGGDGIEARLPVPHFNVVNGGAHASNDLEFQEFMLAPVGAGSLADAVRAGAEIYAELRRLLSARGHTTGLGDEGGFAPEIGTPEEVLEILVAAVAGAGYEPSRQGVAIALDPASSQFHEPDGRYRYAPGVLVSTDELIDRYAELVAAYPIVLIEDGLAEDDWDGWVRLTDRLGERVRLVGDDIFVTNPTIIDRAIQGGVGNAALIKPNQIGTVSETLAAMDVCRAGGYGQFVSHRSGETCDSFIADLAVGRGCGLIKAGAPARGERVAKYNRLLRIAAQRPELGYGPVPDGRLQEGH